MDVLDDEQRPMLIFGCGGLVLVVSCLMVGVAVMLWWVLQLGAPAAA